MQKFERVHHERERLKRVTKFFVVLISETVVCDVTGAVQVLLQAAVGFHQHTSLAASECRKNSQFSANKSQYLRHGAR